MFVDLFQTSREGEGNDWNSAIKGQLDLVLHHNFQKYDNNKAVTILTIIYLNFT